MAWLVETVAKKMIGRLAVAIFGVAPFTAQLLHAITCAQVQPPAYQTSIQVSPGGSDSGTCGSASAPCQTIQQGITRCSGQTNCAVLVRYGTYTVANTINLASGVDVYGSCVFDESDPRYRTIVTGSPAFAATGINAKTLLSGFIINGADATQPNQSSIAMTVSNSNALTISRSVLASGKGGAGATPGVVNGTVGVGGSPPYSNSTGGAGGPACAANPTNVGIGGQGADFQQVYSYLCVLGCTCENNNYPNSLGRTGASSGSVTGGSGGDRSGQLGCMCGSNGNPGDGPTGHPGNPGACGITGGPTSTNIKGAFSGVDWNPSQGGAGDSGQVGSGGGGGGSGGMSTYHGSPDFPGLPGGGGGGGGCGGGGGQGGIQGGASIPLVLSQSSVAGLAVDDALVPGPGGAGGSGANGGQGGPGGSGASGPTGHQTKIEQWAYCTGYSPGSGGQGGPGGQGGAGSGGAGGNGGPSSGIALVNSTNSYAEVVVYPTQPGALGNGVPGGNNSANQCTGASGKNGVAGAGDLILSFP